MSEHPKFDEFKQERMKNPAVRRAYIEAKIRNRPAPVVARPAPQTEPTQGEHHE